MDCFIFLLVSFCYCLDNPLLSEGVSTVGLPQSDWTLGMQDQSTVGGGTLARWSWVV